MKTKVFNYLLAILTVAAFAAAIVLRQDSTFDLALLADYKGMLVQGFFNAILYSVIVLIGSLIVGFIMYIMVKSNWGYFRSLADVLTEIIYGTPLLVLIVIMAYVIGPAFGTHNRTAMGLLAMTVYMAPYMTNVYKAAISSISEAQYMAMKLFGFTSYQKYRYLIIPQVVRQLMPPMMNNFSLIIKGSALLSVINRFEIFYVIKVAQSKTFAFLEGYIVLWILYLVITLPLSQLTKYIERRYGV